MAHFHLRSSSSVHHFPDGPGHVKKFLRRCEHDFLIVTLGFLYASDLDAQNAAGGADAGVSRFFFLFHWEIQFYRIC
jgi:hypothetical protein